MQSARPDASTYHAVNTADARSYHAGKTYHAVKTADARTYHAVDPMLARTMQEKPPMQENVNGLKM